MMRQADFAKFIEENSADLLEMVLDLEKSKNVRVVRKMRTARSDDGQSGSQIEANGTELPSVFNLSIPVYFGELPVPVRAFTPYTASPFTNAAVAFPTTTRKSAIAPIAAAQASLSKKLRARTTNVTHWTKLKTHWPKNGAHDCTIAPRS
jgi:hypothetical protein